MKKTSIVKIICLVLTVTTFTLLAGCSPKEQFSKERAYRDSSEVDPDVPNDIEFITDGWGMTEELRSQALEAYNIINDERVGKGLNPLMWDQDLEECAVIRVQEIIDKFEHTRPNGQYWYTVDAPKVLGENIYSGYGTAKEALASWMKNAPDAENFLCPDFSSGAIAIYKLDNDQCYWVAVFGK